MDQTQLPSRVSARVRIPVQNNDFIDDTPPELREAENTEKRRPRPLKHALEYQQIFRQSQSPVLRVQKKSKTPSTRMVQSASRRASSSSSSSSSSVGRKRAPNPPRERPTHAGDATNTRLE
jgi:hypothetical protein